MRRRLAIAAGLAALLSLPILALATARALQALPADLGQLPAATRNTFFDRHGQRLTVTYQNRWNLHDRVELHRVPALLQSAVLLSEDKRFPAHGGVDWLARASAVLQNLRAGRAVRGASTISEQVVRMLHPRPRTLWSRWLEGFEARRLEQRFSKPEILEFYLNQVPYGARRRGIVQAADYYFDRDLSTLNEKEMLALAVLVRAPRWLDPRRHRPALERAIGRLAQRAAASGRLAIDPAGIHRQPLQTASGTLTHNLSHFVAFARAQPETPLQGRVDTSIDAELQQKVQAVLDTRLDRLAASNAGNGAALVVDHHSNTIVSWAVGHAGRPGKAYGDINAVTVRRQPGSALKPLLYAQALSRGWSAATLLDDAPLEQRVGTGMHTYHNYSRAHYGPVSLREALGNSLNIPAVRAIQYIGAERFLYFLHNLGFTSLAGHPNVYGDGLALGNGEVSLYELVQAYTALARMGDFKPLSYLQTRQHTPRQDPQGGNGTARGRRVLSEDVASLVADILADPGAREKEFGRDSILNFPHQTAVKTGTSSDYRDAWALGFNDRFSAGVWIGNLDYSAMHEVTGSTGPAPVLRAIFNEVNRHRRVRPLYFSNKLVKRRICADSAAPASGNCRARDEWFLPGAPLTPPAADTAIRLRKPSPGLMLAMDPRIPDHLEYFEFALSPSSRIKKVNWFINDRLVASTTDHRYAWPLQRGSFRARAEVLTTDNELPLQTAVVTYHVQ